MNELLFHDPFSNMFKEMEALMDFEFKRESRGLKKWIKKPHNLITRKDENGKVIGFALEVVYTPFKKSDVKVEILDGILTVKCGSENKVKDEDMDYCGISHQSYEFSIPLSDTVDSKKISAKADDGILYINLPVKEIKEKKEQPLQITVE